MSIFNLSKILMEEGKDLENLNNDNVVIYFLSNVGILERIKVSPC
jgi:hypothetical protein